MTVSFEEAEKIRAEYRKMLADKEAEKNKPKKETKAKLPDESVSSSKSEEEKEPLTMEQASDAIGKLTDKETLEKANTLSKSMLTAGHTGAKKKKRGRPKKKKD